MRGYQAMGIEPDRLPGLSGGAEGASKIGITLYFPIVSDIHCKFDFPEHKVKATAVIKVEIESTTGKQAGFK
jgi:hypothetical protein